MLRLSDDDKVSVSVKLLTSSRRGRTPASTIDLALNVDALAWST